MTADANLQPQWMIHIIHEGKTLCGRFDLMSGFPHGHTGVEYPSDDADCRECVSEGLKRAMKR